MFPYASGLAPAGQPGQLGWLPQDFGGSNPPAAASLQPSASFNSLPLFSGQQLAAMQAAAGAHSSLPNMPLGNTAFGLPSLPPGLMGGAPNTPAAGTLANVGVPMPTASQQHHQMALAAALMSQMQGGQHSNQLCSVPQADPVSTFAQSNPALNAWAMILAQHAAAGVLPSLPPELLQQPGGLSGVGAMFGNMDANFFRGPAAATPALAEQQHIHGTGSGHMKPTTPTAQQSLEAASLDHASPHHHSLARDGSSSPGSSSPGTETEGRSQSKSGRKYSQQVLQQEQQPHRTVQNGHPVVDSALVEHSQPGTSEDISSASGCSQPSCTLQSHKAAPASYQYAHAPQVSMEKVSRNSGPTHKATSKLQQPLQQASQQQARSQATNITGSKMAVRTSQGMPPPPPRITGSAATNSVQGTQARAGTAVGSSRPVEQAANLQEHMRSTLGPQQWSTVRAMLLKQQATFVQQLYELHKLNSLQRLLCLEVLGYDPSASSAGGRGPPTAGGAEGGGAGGRGRGSPGTGPGAGPTGSCMSLPSVCAPPAPRGGHDGHHSAKSGGSVDAHGMLQRVQRDLAQMVNIPAQLRSKAKSASPDVSLASKGPSKMVTLGSADAKKQPGVHKPTAMRPLGVDGNLALAQKPATSTEAAPISAPASNGGGLLEAAAAFLQSTGMPLPALAAPSQSTGRAPGSSKGPHAPPLTSKGTVSGAPTPPALLTGSGALGFMPPPPGLQAAAPMLDPHAAWFSKHYTGPSDGGVPAVSGAGVPSADKPLGTSPTPDADRAGLLAPPPVAVGPMGMPILAAPVRWWQDESSTFGDVPPSMVAPQASADGTAAKSGSKRNAKQSGAVQPGSSKKGRMGDAMVDDNSKPAAFKVVRPRKARSKRGSNRLGPGGTRDSVVSDDSGSSLNQDGSCIMGMSTAAPMSVGSGMNWRISCAGPGASPPGLASPAMRSPQHADVHLGDGHMEADTVVHRPAGVAAIEGMGLPAQHMAAQHMGVGMPGGGDAVHHAGGIMQPLRGDRGTRVNQSGSGPSGQQHPLDSSHGSEEKERSAARLLLSLSCMGSVGGLHGNASQMGPAGSIGNMAGAENGAQQAMSVSA